MLYTQRPENNPHWWSFSSGGQKSETGLLGPNIKKPARLQFLEALGESLCSCLFHRGMLHLPWLLAPSIPEGSNGHGTCPHTVSLWSRLLCLPLSQLRTLWLHWAHRGWAPFAEAVDNNLNPICSLNSPLPCNLTSSQALGIDTGYLWGIIILSATPCFHIHPPAAHRAPGGISKPKMNHCSSEETQTPGCLSGLISHRSPSLTLLWPHCGLAAAQTCQNHSCLRAFAVAMDSAQNTVSPGFTWLAPPLPVGFSFSENADLTRYVGPPLPPVPSYHIVLFYFLCT